MYSRNAAFDNTIVLVNKLKPEGQWLHVTKICASSAAGPVCHHFAPGGSANIKS